MTAVVKSTPPHQRHGEAGEDDSCMQLPEEVERRAVGLITLIRYYKWALTLQEHVAPYMRAREAGEEVSDQDAIRTIGLLSYWFASLFVVVEGWQKLRLEDLRIDAMLADTDKLQLLRRFRNGVFHFQSSHTDDRFAEFFAEGLEAVDWAQHLNSAFFDFFAPHLEKPSVRRLETWLIGANRGR
jgi:hypothetical protein